MIKFFSLAAVYFMLFIANAQDSASVLFIGNSYTYVNNLPLLIDNITSSFGDNIYYDSNTPGGATFADHAANPTTYVKINSQLWDFVVLQGQSQEPSFPDAQVNTESIPFAIQIADSVYSNNFCSDVMMFMTWGRENGDPQWGPISTFEGMNDRLRSGYLRIADSVQGSVSPVGSAWRYVRDNYPSIDLYTTDGSHPSYAGSYLAACTFYASIFRKSPIGSTFTGTLSASDAANLQYAASITVLDSLDLWNLRPISEHTQADYTYSVNGMTVDFTNLSTKATGYIWDFGDFTFLPDVHPSHTYAVAGTYNVMLTANSPCDSDSMAYQIVIDQVGLIDLEIGSIQFRYRGQGDYFIEGVEDIDEIQIYNTAGQKVRFRSSKSDTLISLGENSFGIYLIKVATKKGEFTYRLPYLYD
jgi:PKD repeat protein